MKTFERVVLIGSGNVASALAPLLPVVQCYARSENGARQMGELASAPYTSNIREVIPDGDLYIIAVSDDAICEVASILAAFIDSDAVIAHTGGTMPIDIIKWPEAAVFYPLQRFIKGKAVDFKKVPVIIEAKRKENEDSLTALARTISGNVVTMDSAGRRELHIAAVLSCNFTNRLWALAQRRLESNGLSFGLLRPLVRSCSESAVTCDGPLTGLQTGPAVRGDRKTMASHLEMLADDPELRAIYLLLSQSIINEKL